MIKKILGIISVLLSMTISVSIVHAETIRIKLDGTRVQMQVNPELTPLVTFYTVTKGNQSSALAIQARMPANARLTVREALLTKSEGQQLIDKHSFWKVPLRNEKQVEKDNQTCVDFAPGESSSENDDVPPIDRPSSNDPLCNLFSEEELTAIGQALSATYGGTWSRDQVCGYLVNNYFGGAEACDPEKNPICSLLQAINEPTSHFRTAYLSLIEAPVSTLKKFSALIQRDSCRAKNTRYLVAIDIDLSHVSKVDYPIVQISLQANEYQFSGDKAASIKPKSDGKYAPEPILLMSFLGSFCGQNHAVTRWQMSKPRSTTALKVGDLVPYKGRILTRTPIGRVLKGGKASFDLYSAQAAYGVCFNLVPKRQRVNGY